MTVEECRGETGKKKKGNLKEQLVLSSQVSADILFPDIIQTPRDYLRLSGNRKSEG